MRLVVCPQILRIILMCLVVPFFIVNRKHTDRYFFKNNNTLGYDARKLFVFKWVALTLKHFIKCYGERKI